MNDFIDTLRNLGAILCMRSTHTKHLLFSRQSAQGRLHLPVAHTVTPRATKWRRHGHDCAVCTNAAAVSRHAVTHMAVNSDLVPFVLQVPGQVWARPEW